MVLVANIDLGYIDFIMAGLAAAAARGVGCHNTATYELKTVLLRSPMASVMPPDYPGQHATLTLMGPRDGYREV